MTDSGSYSDSIDETLRRRFESAWTQGRPGPIDEFLPAENDPKYLATLEELVHIELEFAWKRRGDAPAQDDGESLSATIASLPRVETYLRRFPRLNRPEIVLRLLQQERFVRRQAGEVAAIEEYCRRFPELAAAGGRFQSLLRIVGGGGDDEAPPAAGGTNHAAAGRALPRQFGNYRLLEEIGRGGMGIVYRARQRTAERIVAVKVIRRDQIESLPRDGRTDAMDRFRHEARAAARLEHDNIVTLYEVGEVDGEPFFSMRYVEGRSLMELLRDGPISNHRAAAYIEPVARAVELAHAKGILHRDLKPQNILVDEKSDRPMVADFGLAKLSESGEELTRAGEIMGSPSYMSPEQAQDSAHVTALSDVYALGATLYHILTGRPPFQAATGLETLRQVIGQEPVALRRLNPSIDRDLETVCLKCLQKEPLRRYGSAAALADDLRRYLNGRPILARPIGAARRAVRWCRRNPAVAALIASTLAFLVLALVAGAVGYFRTSAALTQSEANYQQVRRTVDDFFTQVSENRLLNRPGMQPLRQELLQQALDYYRRFVAERGDDPTIRDELAMTYFRIGRITEQVDSPDAALPSYRRALTTQRQLLAQSPHDPDRLLALGNTLNAIGGALLRQGKLDSARKAYREAVAIRTQLVRAESDQPESKRKLANSYMNAALVEQKAGDFQQAQRQFEKAQSLRKEILRQSPGDPQTRRDLGMGYYNLANLALSLQKPDYRQAQNSLTQGIAVFEELLRDNPHDLANQYRLAICCRQSADLKCVRQDWAAALALYRQALERMETLARSNPQVPEYQSALAGLHMNLGQFQRDRQQGDSALESFRQAAAILEELVAEFPSVPLYRRDLAVTLLQDAELKSAAGRTQPARQALEAARAHLRTLVEEHPDNQQFKALLDQAGGAMENLN